MDGMGLVCGGLFLFVLPIALFVMTAGMSSRLYDIERALKKIAGKIDQLESLHRQTLGQAGQEPPQAHGLTEPGTGARAAAETAFEPRASSEPSVPAHEPTPSPEPALAASKSSATDAPTTTEPEKTAPTIAEKTLTPPAISPKPAPQMQDAPPSWLELQIDQAKSWLFAEGNIWVTIGVLLFIGGFGLLFSYAAQMNWLSYEARLAMAGLAGAAMTAFGWRTRDSRRTYALILQGGGVGVMYVVLVAGAKHGSFSPTLAIACLIALSAFTVWLAIRQDFEPLALFALIGGYAAPIIVSTGSSNFVALFSIHALLNLEILAINAGRDWRKTRWGGMTVSALTGAAWGLMKWRAELLKTVEPFMILFFINYTATALMPMARAKLARWVSPDRKIDLPMAAAVPFIFLALHVAAAEHTAFGVSIACAALGAVYIALYQASRRGGDAHRGLRDLSAAYGALFLNLAVPFAFRKAASSCIWAAEGAALVTCRGKFGRRVLAPGIILQASALLIYLFGPFIKISSSMYEPMFRMKGFMDWRNADSNFLLTALIFAASAFVSSYFIERTRGDGVKIFKTPDKTQRVKTEWAFSAYGAMWWTLAATHAATFVIRTPDVTALLFLCAGACAAYFAASLIGWQSSVAAAFPPVAAMTAFRLWHLFPGAVPFTADAMVTELFPILYSAVMGTNLLNWIAAAAMFAAAILFYRGAEARRANSVCWAFALFAFASYTASQWSRWLSAIISAIHWEALGELSRVAYFLPIMASVALFALGRGARKLGMERYRTASGASCWALMAVASASFVSGLFNISGGLIFRRYIPLLNPLELWQMMFMASAYLLLASSRGGAARRIGLNYILPGVIFLWLNCVAARAAWHCFGERVALGTLGRAPHFQAIIAILWGTAALLLIYFGKRLAERRPWFLGAGLLALDIAKLLLFDLRNSATIIRIVAFLLTGGFFLLVGWTAPLPPKKGDADGR